MRVIDCGTDFIRSNASWNVSTVRNGILSNFAIIVAVLSLPPIASLHAADTPRVTRDLQALYTFEAGRGDVVEGLDHAQHGAQEPQQRSDGGDSVEHSQVNPQFADLAFSTIDDRLFHLDTRLAPLADPVSEHRSDRAVALLSRQRLEHP